MEAQQCVKLTSTNRPFGLTIKLSQLVVICIPRDCKIAKEKATQQLYSKHGLWSCQQIWWLPFGVVSLSFFGPRGVSRMSLEGLGMSQFFYNEFLAIISRGSHPFPSRTRKLSPAEPMILHG